MVFKINSVLACFLLFGITINAQNNKPHLDTSNTKPWSFFYNHVFEKAYLHFDKPYYAAGDTVYFRAYVSAGKNHSLNKVSGVLFVDLINTNNKIDQSIKLQLNGGIANGDFSLPDSLPFGNYRIRAYTRWMQNNEGYGVFEKTIPIGSLSSNKAIQTSAKKNIQNPKADVQFFPEGGNLIIGISSKVAFKAIGLNGNGVDIKGTIYNQDNKIITSFHSEHLGMGYFYFEPKEGESYNAKYIVKGVEDEVGLPKAIISGITLRINNEASLKTSISILTNQPYYQANKGKDYQLLIYSGNSLTKLNCKLDSSIINLDILKRNLSTGVATVTLITNHNEPLCERLFFVQNNDQLTLNINSDKKIYGKREKVKINLTAKNRADSAASGHFSVSVINEDKVPFDDNNENTILTNMLLTSDLKGYIEAPNYYFNDTSQTARKKLDILMLTQGYRKFEWKRVLSDAYPTIAYQPEKGLGITGKVTNLLNKPISNGTITLIPSGGGSILSTTSDEKGIFHFENLIFADTTHFVLSAVKANGKNSTRITWLQDKGLPVLDNLNAFRQISDTAMSVYLSYTEKNRNEGINYGKNKGILLKEVKIKAKKIDNQYHTESLAGAGNADQVMHADEIEQIGGTLSASLNGRLRGVGFVQGIAYLKSPPSNGPMVVIVDGQEFSGGETKNGGLPFKIDDIPVSQIETIEVLRYGGASIYGMDSGNGVLIITTKRGGASNAKNLASIGILPITPGGFYKAREFYGPKYEHIDTGSKYKDLRSIVYWNPIVKTDKNGNADFEYYNTDAPGTYKLIIEGMDENGNIGRQVLRYRVNNAFPFAQINKTGNSLLKLTTLADSVTKLNNIEKPYLQFDKPYYTQGDTIWFKAYLFNTYMAASHKSNLLNIDIANDSNKIVKQLRIPLINGLGWGSINLDEKEFASGTYTLRAYTNWMRNFGDDYFFYKNFYITSPLENKWLVNRQINLVTDSGIKKAFIKLQLTDMAKKLYQVKDVNLQVLNGDKHLYHHKFLTDLNGSVDLNFALPQKNNGLAIVVEDPLKDKKAVIPIPLNRPENTDLQFLPEGGSMVAGLPAYIGFKAIGEDGKGQNISGIITDNENNTIAEFSSLHNGMGNVYIAPKAGETYTAKVNLPGGLVKNYPLPAIKNSGMVLHIKNRIESDSLDVLVASTPDIGALGDNYYLIGRARGIVCYAAVFNLKNLDFIKQKIPKSLFPTGVAHFTVMTANNQPINDRLVYIDRHDRLNVQIITDKPTYAARDSVSVKIKVTNKNGNPIVGSFSMAVTDDKQVNQDTLNRENILTRMLFTADLKGFIEEPGYYLNNKSDTAWHALDNLLLTQGWVNYSWKQVFNPPTITYQPENELKVNGTVKNVFNIPVKGSNVLLFSIKPKMLMDTITDQNGKFVFDRLPKIDTPVFFLKAVNRNGKSFNVNIGIDETKTPDFMKPFGIKTPPWYIEGDSILLNYTKTRASLSETENLAKGSHLLKEVKIKATKVIRGSQNLNGPGEADQVIDEKDLEKTGKKTLLQLLQESVKGFGERFFNPYSASDNILSKNVSDGHKPNEWYSINRKPIKFIIDGISAAQVISSEESATSFIDIRNFLTGLLAEDIKGIEVNFTPKYTSTYELRYNLNYDYAIIEITTRSGNGPYFNNTPGRYLYKPLPISSPVAFYKPKYTVKDQTKHTTDLRSTISWEPNIITDKNGEANLWFYTTDATSTYTLTLEGSDFNGNIGFKIDNINNIKLENKTK